MITVVHNNVDMYVHHHIRYDNICGYEHINMNNVVMIRIGIFNYIKENIQPHVRNIRQFDINFMPY